jgi:hypothetical protein
MAVITVAGVRRDQLHHSNHLHPRRYHIAFDPTPRSGIRTNGRSLWLPGVFRTAQKALGTAWLRGSRQARAPPARASRRGRLLDDHHLRDGAAERRPPARVVSAPAIAATFAQLRGNSGRPAHAAPASTLTRSNARRTLALTTSNEGWRLRVAGHGATSLLRRSKRSQVSPVGNRCRSCFAGEPCGSSRCSLSLPS